jgi:hypothetical protein
MCMQETSLNIYSGKSFVLLQIGRDTVEVGKGVHDDDGVEPDSDWVLCTYSIDRIEFRYILQFFSTQFIIKSVELQRLV